MTEQLSPTAKVILGMLRMKPASGYEIKALIDHSTSFFWRAGYGSIYPELKRLSDAGLIEGTEADAGDRRRVVHRLTAAGRRALQKWLATEPVAPELRDEGMLHLFFADDDEHLADALERKAEGHAAIVARLEEIEPMAQAMDAPGPLATLRLGLEQHRAARDWCRREARRVGGRPAEED